MRLDASDAFYSSRLWTKTTSRPVPAVEGTVRDRHVANYWTAAAAAAVVELEELETAAAGQNGQSHFPQQNKMNDLEVVAALESFGSHHPYQGSAPTRTMLLQPSQPIFAKNYFFAYFSLLDVPKAAPKL